MSPYCTKLLFKYVNQRVNTSKVIYILIPCEVGIMSIVVVGIHGEVVEGTAKTTWIMHAISFIDTQFIA